MVLFYIIVLLNKNIIPGLINQVLSQSLYDNTKLRALYIHLTIQLERILSNLEKWESLALKNVKLKSE